MNLIRDGEDDEDVSVVWEDSEIPLEDRELVCWPEDNTPLDVVLLASLAPLIAMGCEGIL
jgi:hypothetical protein